MITIVHGDDTTKSRARILSLLENVEHEILDSKKTEEDIDIAFSNSGLFLDSKTIFIDCLSKFKGNAYKKCLDYVMQNDLTSDINILVWDSKTIDKRILAKFKKAVIEPYVLPKHFFAFIDGLTPNNGPRLHDLLFKLYPQFAAEQLFNAIINRTRLLLMAKSGGQFDEIQKMAPFQKTKISHQASLWTTNDIIDFYKKLFDTEVAVKTSTLPLPLVNHIDFLLVSELR